MAKIPVVELDKCIGCGLCVSTCPDVFELDNNGKSVVKDPDGCDKCDCQNAIDGCPSDAISWKEEDQEG